MVNTTEDIKIEPYKLPIQLWFKSIDHYIVKPFFQREHVWNTVQESSLIESILLGYPIPTIYSYLELASGKELIIDGQQRLTAIRRFINNAFSLKNLKILTEYCDHKFNELPFLEQNKILNYKITITSLNGITDKQTIFEIFHRYNTGGVNLNNQEIRNAIYCGKYNDFIKNKLVKYPPYRDNFTKNQVQRLVREELAARFLAFYERLSLYEEENIDLFINNHYISKLHYNDLNEEELNQIFKEQERVFKDAFNACKLVFGSYAFRRIEKIGEMKDNFVYKGFSRLVYDMQMLGFAEYDFKLIKNHTKQLKRAYENLVLTHPEMEPCGKNKNTIKRIRRWQEIVYKIINE